MDELDAEDLKERSRICNLDRKELVGEWVDGISLIDMRDMLFDYIYEDDATYCDDTLRHDLLP